MPDQENPPRVHPRLHSPLFQARRAEAITATCSQSALIPPLKKLLTDAQAGLQGDLLRTVGLLGQGAVEALRPEIEALADGSDSIEIGNIAKTILRGQ